MTPAVFTPDQEARIGEIIAAKVEALRVRLLSDLYKVIQAEGCGQQIRDSLAANESKSAATLSAMAAVVGEASLD